MMKKRKSGSRHVLLFYRRTMDRLWKTTFVLGLVLAIAGGWTLVQDTPVFGISSNVWLFAGAVLAFALSIFAFLARFRAYTQVYANYLSVVTPFLHLKISFKRMRSIHPVLVQQLFPKDEASWAERSFLEPFYGKTAVVITMRGYPLNPKLLRLFLPAQMFSPRTTGLVLMVPDWMKFSTELDSFHGAWLQTQGGQARFGQSSGRF
jgi:hypothetical protein